MRSGEEGSTPVPSPACSGLRAPPTVPGPHWLSPDRPLPCRYGGFSLGGRDPGLPSGQEVSRSVEELQALLSPPPGGALDRILNNLTAWARSLDAEDSLKVGAGGAGRGLGGGPSQRPDRSALTPP